jgi:hypothetical protein
MKSFQFYSVDGFPKLLPGNSVEGAIQQVFGFVEESQPVTRLTLKKTNYSGSLDLLHIESEVVFNSHGYISREFDGERKRFDFMSYNHPVAFSAYYDSTKNVLILPQSKRITKPVYSNLNMLPSVKLDEMVVDFQKVKKICGEDYRGAWFRGVSPQVSAAGLVGNRIQDDEYFQKLDRQGELSNVTVDWPFGGAPHRVMVTKGSAIVLQFDYRDNQDLELNLVIDVFDNLLSQTWSQKPKRRKSQKEVDIPVEP